MILIVICSLLFDICKAQWQPDVRLTNEPHGSYTSYNNAWCVASSGDTLHLVWQDNRNGEFNWDLYYIRSTDNGLSWGAELQLTNDPHWSTYPCIAVSGQEVHVVWPDTRNYSSGEIYYKHSTNGGLNWETDVRLTFGNNIAGAWDPSIAVSSQDVHVVWDDYRDLNYEIYYKRSTDGGMTWGNDIRLTNNDSDSFCPSVAASGQYVHIVWFDRRDGNREVYYKRSTDRGISWEQDLRLTHNQFLSVSPCIAVSGQVVHIVWMDQRDMNDEIYYKRSTDGGMTWGADTRLTYNNWISLYPVLAVSGQVVHVVWEDTRDLNYEIYYKRSTDGGTDWDPDVRLTYDTAYSLYPCVCVSGSSVHAVWTDERDGNYEVYYKRNPTGNTIGIKNISSEVPKEFNLFQNYPNPFNPTTKIRFDMPTVGQRHAFDVRFVIYDILGRVVSILVNEQLKPGTYEVEWDTSNYPSGVYFYRLSTDDYANTKKMVLVK
jgi:hypothetical protein